MNAAKLGLKKSELNELTRNILLFSEIEAAYVFGSRAKGSNKPGSDIDLAISGADVDYSIVSNLSYMLNEETVLPYFFDVVHMEKITSKSLQQHIADYGVDIISGHKFEIAP